MKLPRFTLRGFKSPREALLSALGPLESEVLNVVWLRAETCVRDVYMHLDHRVAYTTLMTTLDRLFKKGLLQRRKEGRAYYYRATVSAQELEQGVAEDVLTGLLGGESGRLEPVLACFVDAVSARNSALLDDLDRLIQAKRESLKRKETES